MDEEVRNLLKAWNLDAYIEVFKDNEITSLSLPLLGEAETKDLIPKVGPRSIFLRNLEIYKKTMHPDCQNSTACEDFDISITDLLHYPLENQAGTSTPTPKSPIPIASSLPNPTLTIAVPADSQIIDVYDLKLLLSSSLEGKGLLNLDNNIPLENASRQRLVRLIGTAILRDTPDKLIRTTVYANWAREIVRVFPCEKPSVYFHSKIVESTRGLITRLAGKLPDQIHNLKGKYRESGVIEKRRRISRSSDTSNPSSPLLRLPEEYILEQEEDIPDAILWLKNSSEPWSTVLQKWTETTRTRLNLSKELSISQYFKEYPALKKPTGYVLLEKDFEELYAGKYTDIVESFAPLKEKKIKLAEKKNNAHSKDTTLNELLSLKDSSEESSNIACMLLIPTLLAVTSIRLKNCQKKVWRPSKAEVREGFITHVKNDCDVRSVINARREKFRQWGLTVQPFIIIVGTSLDTIKSYFVIIDEVWYDLPNILSVVSACFKLIWVVNAQYSAECLSTWMFIQRAYFKLNTKFDTQSTSAHTLLGELGIDI
ncbi:uncharacterized protein LOC133525234 isoform X1 [Cydia pomonella]|uniref:uncharacterized protein LOC133525234 isoform X1 n=1 Tax=Cydia pomonella TaxID=82600 RepID=UPI002ADE2C33|nr:uncharacterized protein LOC133525234 isoform X1 [Cydia pomonella]